MFDRRIIDWTTLNAYLFEARFDDGLTIEVQVNPEFGSTSAARMRQTSTAASSASCRPVSGPGLKPSGSIEGTSFSAVGTTTFSFIRAMPTNRCREGSWKKN